jgi:hypothetical protein
MTRSTCSWRNFTTRPGVSRTSGSWFWSSSSLSRPPTLAGET